MKKHPAQPSRQTGHYPRGFVFGQGRANPAEFSLAGLKIKHALQALAGVKGLVLELGAGGGQYLRALQHDRPDLGLYAVDLDPRAVEILKSLSGVQCQVADVANLPYPAGHFAALLGFDILEHVADPKKVLAETARVLQPEGILHMYLPCEGNVGTVYTRRGHAVKARWGGHVQQFQSAALIRMLQQAGFEIIGIRYADYWLTQQFDYAFFQRLAQSGNPALLWQAQALKPGGGLLAWGLRLARRSLSLLSWLESTLRHSDRGAMGMHVTARKRSDYFGFQFE